MNPNSHNEIVLIETAAQYTDDDILSTGYWKLSEDGRDWVCVESVSIHNYNFCEQTGSFANDNFVQSFQLRLENQDVIIVTINPDKDPNGSFRKYWYGTYTTVYGHDESLWEGKELYVIYFQVGDSTDLRRVIYTKDISDAKEGRIFTTEFRYIIEDTFN